MKQMTTRQGTGDRNALQLIYKFAKARKAYITMLSCFVVFVATYLLILPAMTLDQDEAARQGGIDVPAQTEEVQTEQTEQTEQAAASPDDTAKDIEATKPKQEEKPETKVFTTEDEVSDDASSEEDAESAVAEGDLSYKGENYTVNLFFDEDAMIPDTAKLKVREISPEEEAYKSLQTKAGEDLSTKLKETIPAHPVLLDIAIYDGDHEIEPAKGSSVKVEVSLQKEHMNGIYSDEDSPILINGDPIDSEQQEMTEQLQVIHEVDDKDLKAVDVKDNQKKDKILGTFETDSFSNYLVFLDQDVDEITVGRGDTITLRPYSQWVWDQQNTVDGRTVSWKQPDPQGHMTWESKHYKDNELGQEYDYYQLTATTNPGDFYIETTEGKKIHVIVKGETMSGIPGTVDGIDTIKVNLFNYDLDKSLDVQENVASYIDAQNGQYKKFEWDRFGNQVTTTQQGPFANDGINAGSALKFLGWGASNGGNRINNYDSTSPTTGIVSNTLAVGTDGKKYPKLNGNGNTNLQYLFSAGNSDVDAHFGVTGLFRQDEDGYYYFNSNTNYAIYNADNTFTLYEHTYTQATTRNNTTGKDENSKPIGFFPFHAYDSNNDLSPNHDTNLDHHFGLSMEVKFKLPPDKKLHKEGGATDEIIFEFSGDDDMWVFVDDNLSLDVGGIHQPITGSINFTNDNRFQGGQEYTLRIFYLERGGCDSNCSIRFNIPLTKRPFSFEKQDAKDKSKFLQGAKFKLFKDAACKISAVDDTNGEVYTAVSNENGVVLFPSVSIGTYYMKEIEAPEGYRLDETVRMVKLTEDGVIIEGDADPSREGTQIANQKNPELTVEKKWQNQNGDEITPPDDASATFQLKRYYRCEGEEEVSDPSQPVTFRVYRYRENHTPKQVGSDYTFKGGTTVKVNWDYCDYYNNWDWESVKHYKETPEENYRYKSDPVTITLPASGEAAIYIRDENVDEEYRWGEGVKNITVNGTPYEPTNTTRPVSTDWAKDTEYTGPSITLPQDKIDAEHPWKGKFSNLTVTETKNKLTYHYKYYIEETAKAPSNSTVVYVDSNGTVVSDPSTLQTDQDGTQTVINKVPNGSLKLRKWVTIAGVSPNDVSDLKSKADGEYTFTVAGIPETPTAGISKTVTIKIENGKAAKAWIDDTEVSFDNTNDLFVEVPDLTPGDYTITEDPTSIADVWLSSITGGKNDGDVEIRTITVTVAADKSGNDVESAGKATFTNNYRPDSEEDIAHISIKKTFEGLPAGTVLDNDFKITIQVAGKTYELTSNPTDPAVTFDGSHFPVCSWTVSVKGLLKDSQVTVKEVNAGYPAYDVTTSINGSSNTTTYTGTVSPSTIIQAFVPHIYPQNNKLDFNVTDTKIFMALLTDGHVLVISKNRLSLSERAAVEGLLAGTIQPGMSQGNWKKELPPYYYVADENRPFHFKGATITYNNDTVHFDKKCQWTHTAEVAITYHPGSPADFNFVNSYTEKSVGMEILKVDAGDMRTPLKGAGFVIHRIDPATARYTEAPAFYPATSGDDHKTGADGKASFNGLTEGYYEVKEEFLPAGYIQTGDGVFYIRVHNGVVSLIEKDSSAETGWKERSSGGKLLFTAAEGETPALATVGNESGAALPSSGGPGTTWFYLIGSILLLGCGVLLAARRRVSH